MKRLQFYLLVLLFVGHICPIDAAVPSNRTLVAGAGLTAAIGGAVAGHLLSKKYNKLRQEHIEAELKEREMLDNQPDLAQKRGLAIVLDSFDREEKIDRYRFLRNISGLASAGGVLALLAAYAFMNSGNNTENTQGQAPNNSPHQNNGRQNQVQARAASQSPQSSAPARVVRRPPPPTNIFGINTSVSPRNLDEFTQWYEEGRAALAAKQAETDDPYEQEQLEHQWADLIFADGRQFYPDGSVKTNSKGDVSIDRSKIGPGERLRERLYRERNWEALDKLWRFNGGPLIYDYKGTMVSQGGAGRPVKYYDWYPSPPAPPKPPKPKLSPEEQAFRTLKREKVREIAQAVSAAGRSQNRLNSRHDSLSRAERRARGAFSKESDPRKKLLREIELYPKQKALKEYKLHMEQEIARMDRQIAYLRDWEERYRYWKPTVDAIERDRAALEEKIKRIKASKKTVRAGMRMNSNPLFKRENDITDSLRKSKKDLERLTKRLESIRKHDRDPENPLKGASRRNRNKSEDDGWEEAKECSDSEE